MLVFFKKKRNYKNFRQQSHCPRRERGALLYSLGPSLAVPGAVCPREAAAAGRDAPGAGPAPPARNFSAFLV